MPMKNTALCGEFWKIMADLESDNAVANVAAVNRASALIAGGKLPDPVLLRRLIAGLASNLSKSHHDITVKMEVHSTLIVIRAAIMRNNMNMDPSVCHDTLHAIHCCLMDEAFRHIQRHGGMVRLWTVEEQLMAVNVICIFLRRSLVNITDERSVTAFSSLMLSPHAIVVRACMVALLSLPPVVPGFVFAVAGAYCKLLMELPPQSFLQIYSVVVIFDRLKQIIPTMVNYPGFNDLATDVLWALANQNLVVRKKVLNLAMSLLTPLNVKNVLRLLRTELNMAASADTPFDYHQMLEEVIGECHSTFLVSTMPFILEPKYIVFVDCIDCIKDIVDNNPLLHTQLVNGLVRVLRHVRSTPVCAATVWAISVCSVFPSEVRSAIRAITCLFKDLLEQRKLEKEISGGAEVQYGYTLHIDYYRAKEGDAQRKHQRDQWLMEMEELMFVHLGLTRHADGRYSIASSSKSSTCAEDESPIPLYLEHTDNLARLVGSGDALLADFVGNVLSRLLEMEKEDE